MRRFLTTFALGAALVTPVSLLAFDHDDEHHSKRYYDSEQRDYHEWNDGEQRAYRDYVKEQHREYRDWDRLKPEEQRDYWRWRHHHHEEMERHTEMPRDTH